MPRCASWRYWLGLESDRDVFKRYREIRKAERESMVAPARPAAQIA